jgi:predicted ATPase/serine/threonine protein kinase/tetratricopeptide (TPR) repeat protein
VAAISLDAAHVIKGYELREQIAIGAAGTVYRAYQPSVRRQVLVRVIGPTLAHQPEFMNRFDAEALRIGRLEHPHILPLYDYWHDETGAYMVARYLPRTLRQALANGPCTLEGALRLAEQLALGMDAAHHAGVVHQALAPDLILLDDEDNAYLAGFVLAQRSVAAGDRSPYLAPEQQTGEPVTAQAGVYSLGVIVYEALTGAAPERMGDDLPPVRTWQSSLPAALDAVLQTATARQPNHRYADGRRFADALRAAAAPAARPQPLIDPLTGRELDILQCMMRGLDNAEIADVLVVASSTVKWYVKQIYSKLDAHSREEAVERAQALGLTEKGAQPAPPTPEPAPVKPLPVVRGLPNFSLPFIGRERALGDVTALLRDPSRQLISIVAPGGMGKTRLAAEAAHAALASCPDGVFYLSLAALTAEQLPEEMLRALGVISAPDRPPWAQVIAYFAPRCGLLVLDNFEALLEAAPRVADLVAAAPRLKVLVTTRERLRLECETVYTLGSMESPPDLGGPPAVVESMQLFIERARRVRYGFTADETNLPAIADICRLVDGMPLAIVLAASWAEMLSPAEIAAEIRANTEFLAADYTDLPERQRSIRIVFESAWERLSEDERRTFARLSIFHGGFTRGAAQAVAGALLHGLAALVTKALIWTDESGRYMLHELLRQFAGERLAAAGEADALRAAHSQYYLEWCARMEAELCGPNPNPAPSLNAMDSDWHNLRAALLWAASHHRPQWITPCWKTLWVYCERHSRHMAGMALLQEVCTLLRRLPESVERDGALGIMLTCLSTQAAAMWDPHGDRDTLLEQSLPLLERGGSPQMIAFWYAVRGTDLPTEDMAPRHDYLAEALARFRAIGDPWGESNTLTSIAWQGFASGDRERRARALQDALEAQTLAQATGDLLLQSLALNILALLEAGLSRKAESINHFTQALAMARLGGSQKRECNTLNNLALQQMNWGALDTAQALMETSLAIRREVLPFSFIGFEDLGEALLRKGEFERAGPLFDEAESRFERSAQPRWTQIYLLYHARTAFCLGQWDALAARVREMQAFTRETGVAYKLHFALATAAYAAYALDDMGSARAALADCEALADGHDPAIEVLVAILRAEGIRRAGEPIKATAALRAALVTLERDIIEPVAAGWEDYFTPLQARELLVRALLDAGEVAEARTVALMALDRAYAIKAPPFVMGALLACARVEAAAGETESALEAAALIAHSPRAFAADRLGAQALLAEMEPRVPAGVIIGVAEQGRALDWEQAAADRLALAE